VYDIGEQGGRSFIAMELLEGLTLRERLDAGPLGASAAIDIGAQIADALEAAHAAGIVHRDIKPANIFIGSRGHVKVLDFGIAKMRDVDAAQADVPTVTATRYGAVIGTAAYMAPEQARGETVDHRADIWSLGLVLYEMITGTRLNPGLKVQFDGEPELERIVSKCLESDRALRYQHAGDLRIDLERLKHAAPQPSKNARAGRWLVVAVAAVAVAAVAAYIFYPRQASALTDKDTIVLAEFTNTTGDVVFDDTLRQGLAVQLQQSPFLSLISEERIRRTLLLMNQPADARLTPELAQGVCARTGGAAVLSGSIAPLGSQYVLGLRATEMHDWGHPRRRAGAGRAEGGHPQHAQRDRHAVPNARWRIAGHDSEAFDAARGSDHTLARGVEGLQRRDAHTPHVDAPAAAPACDRTRPRVCDGPRAFGVPLQHPWGVGAGAGKSGQGVPAAPSHQRP
jgi:hypothetical protein